MDTRLKHRPQRKRTARRRVIVLAAVLLVAPALAGCGRTADDGRPGAADDEGRGARAARLLERFEAAQKRTDAPALAILPDDLERQDADWEEAVGENDKLAWITGHLEATPALSGERSRATAVTGSGERVTTDVISAREALAAMAARRTDCNGCTDLQVTSALLTTMDVSTSSGTANVPAWRFALRGTAVGLLRVALPETAIVPPDLTSPTQPQPGDGLRVDSISLDGERIVRLHFTGAADEPGPCGADYREEHWSSDTAVVVAVVEVSRDAPADGAACNAMGHLRTLDVALDTALGRRTVLNLVGGTVVVRD